MSFEHELDLLIRSSYPLLYIPTPEEERAEDLIGAAAAQSTPSRAIYTWDFVEGYRHNNHARASPLEALTEIEHAPAESPAIFVLRDFHRFVDDIAVSRQLRSMTRMLRATRKTVILLSPLLHIPPDLQEDVTVLDLDPPGYDEIRGELERLLEDVSIQLEQGGLEALVKACLGLTMSRIQQVIARAIVQFGKIDERAISLVLEEKKQSIHRTEVLEFSPAAETIDDIGGLDLLKRWLEARASAFTEEARAYGLPNPKGILMVGIQGTGKSLAAKATASLWQLPLLRLDIGRLMGGLVGESEAKTREMIRLAEAMAPCVLFLDELDKGFAGIGRAAGDSGTSARVFATLLTWMEEKTGPVFVAATANAVETLPPEVLRKGRFDEIFYIDLPSERERSEIFMVHLGRVRGDLLRNYDLNALAFQSEGFSGAEIEQAIYEAMHNAFDQGREFTTEDILQAMSDMVPLSRSVADQIERIQQWAAAGRVRPASSDTAQAGVYGQLFGDSA